MAITRRELIAGAAAGGAGLVVGGVVGKVAFGDGDGGGGGGASGLSGQAQDVVELLSDPSRCQVLLVTLPEETPVNELIDTAFAIEDRVGVRLGPVVVNGCYDELPLDATSATAAAALADAEILDVFVSDREAQDLADAAAFRTERAAIQAAQADRLAERLPLPQIRLPFIFSSELGVPEIGRLADAFVTGVEAIP